ncbi:MAG: T9SS type A sorting domain-containing protein [Bacteroidota bacterium]
MKNYYLTFFLALLCLSAFGQEEELIPGAVVGSCIEPDSNIVNLFFDYSKNCPQADPNMLLAGVQNLGFHSGINNWSTQVDFDADNAMTMTNLGNDVFVLKINTVDYYGTPLADIQTLHFLMRSENSDDSWDFTCKDDQGGGGFGGDEPCNDFILTIANMPTCSELNKESSASLFGATTAANSCIDTIANSVRVEFDLSLNCPEADPDGVLMGASALGFHSGANEWAEIVAWDDEGAVQATNNGSDVFGLTVNIEDYYGIPFDSLESIFFDLTNGPADPDGAFDITGKDDRDGGFGGAEPCSNLRLFISEMAVCEAGAPVDTMPEPEVVSSAALLAPGGDVSTCVDASRGKVRIGFDLSLNCPEADTLGLLPGASALGFQSGANGLGGDFDVVWDDSTAMTAVNNGSDIFSLTLNVTDYYGIEFDSLNFIQMVMNNGVADPENPWDATGKDERAGGFGGACSDLIIDISEASTCILPNEGEILSSPALLSDSSGTCMDRNFGLLKIGFDYALNCTDADTLGLLDGAPVIGFHSGANNWSQTIAWDAEGAKQATNEGNNVFSLVINPAAYYGLPLEDIENIEFLFNNGPAMPEDPWAAKGESSAPGAFGACGNLLVYLDELPGCDLSETATSHSLLNGLASTTTCMDSMGMLTIGFDLSLNCPEADSANVLTGTSTLGFHSGINEWSSTIIAWDDEGAIQAVNDGNDMFSVTFDPAAYYGTSLDSIENIFFDLNNGPAMPDAPWELTGKDSRDNVGGFGADPCSNLRIIMSEVPSCASLVATSVKDEVLTQSLRVYPNPAQNNFRVEFDNLEGKAYDLMLVDLTGKAVQTVQAVRGNYVEMKREGLADGIYFLRLIDEKGKYATTTLLLN